MAGEAQASTLPIATMCQPDKKPARDWDPIVGLTRTNLNSEVGSRCNGGRGPGFGITPSYHTHPLSQDRATMPQPDQQPAHAWNPTGRLMLKKLDSNVGSMRDGGRGPGFDLTPMPQCVSTTKNMLRIGIPLAALSEKSWMPSLDRCAMVGEAQASD
jgi:hypothetical protein